MRFPDKITSYKESVLCLIPLALEKLAICDMTPRELYDTLKDKVSISDFVDVMDCLCSLGKVEFLEHEGVLHYVA
jgi:hypothetical protein